MSLEVIRPKIPFDTILEDMKKTLHHYEDIFSRFTSESLISKLNQGEEVEMIQEFRDVCKKAQMLHDFTNGLFNPHINMKEHGYSQSFERKKFEKEIEFKEVISKFPDALHIQGNTAKLSQGNSIDFGGLLKGYLSGLIAERHAGNCQGIIVNLGGDLSSRGDDLESDGFEFNIINPVTGENHFLTLKDQSLSTSGSYKRGWKIGNKEKNHLINPQSNESTDSIFSSISFWGKDGSLVDALSTAAFFTDTETWDTWIASKPGLHYLGIKKDGCIITV